MSGGFPIQEEYNAYLNVMRPRQFRKPKGVKQVKGGRWSIRKYQHCAPERQWRAWVADTAKARRWNRRFPTHAQAVAWASGVAQLYAMPGMADAERDFRIRTLYREVRG